jgi:CheY-like chemotaxis protein
MDHMMPGMDGIEAVARIRAIDSAYAREIPVIALTANAVAGAKELFLAHGFQDFLSKPIHIKELDAILKKWVRNYKNENIAKEIEKEKAPEAKMNPGEERKEKKQLRDIPLLDYDKAMLLYDGDDEMFAIIAASFVTHIPPILKQMEEMFAQIGEGGQDFTGLLNELGILAHGIKGSCSNITAEKGRAVAAELEKAAKDGDWDKCKLLFPQFIEEVSALLLELG